MIEIRKARKDELSGLILVYKQAFSKHGIFSKEPEEIIDYLENAMGEFIIAIDDSKQEVVAGILAVKTEPDKDHVIARLKHFAVAQAYQGQGIGKGMIKEAERVIGKAKVEIHVSENEKDAIVFYEKQGYVIEGKLLNHYRDDETCYILGKSLNPE